MLEVMVLLMSFASAPATQPALWNEMVQVDQQAARITDLTAHFEQRKYTALLKKPLISSGIVRVKGSAMLWETSKPEASALRVDDRDVRVYYPEQKTLEIYAVQQKLANLAASPLPRLEVLKNYFSFEPEKSENPEQLAVKMLPTDPALAEHVQEVHVVLDRQAGYILRLEMTDSDGDRTVITFSNHKVNTGLKANDLEIKLPKGVKVTHPLAALEGGK